MKLAVKAAIAVVIALALVAVGIKLFKGKTVDTAIGYYEDGDYDDAIRLLNRLVGTLDYEQAEKAYYYRCRSINRYAEKLERKYDDELSVLGEQAGDAKPERIRDYREKLTHKLASINESIDGDLTLAAGRSRGRIVSGGKFYNQFLAKYKGSRFLEDLDFEELQKIERTEGHRLLRSIANFHARYPSTTYLAQVVKMLFDALKRGEVQIKEKDDFLANLIIQFGRKYPTSSEFSRLFVCNSESVNMRNSPDTRGALVAKIDKGEILIQLEKSMDTFQVGDVRDYWYRVATLRGHAGWIFGKFLAPIDMSRFKDVETEERWSLDERFADWTDSHTPKNWMHVDERGSGAVSFSSREGANRLVFNASHAGGAPAGLYRKAPAGRSFVILARARFAGGSPVTLFANSMPGEKVFAVVIGDEEVEVSGRRIPLRTGEWHEYRLESEDGAFARLIVDGEVISSRINPVRNAAYRSTGIYCLFAPAGVIGAAEMEYIKLRN